MAKYRVEFENKRLKSIGPTEETDPSIDTFLEEETGATIWATIEAADYAEANEKATRLEQELQTRHTKRDIAGREGN